LVVEGSGAGPNGGYLVITKAKKAAQGSVADLVARRGGSVEGGEEGGEKGLGTVVGRSFVGQPDSWKTLWQLSIFII